MTDFINEAMKDKKPIGDEIRIELRNQSFIQLMRTRDGRRFVWWALEQTGFTAQTFTGHRDATDFNCGKRDAGVWLFALVDQFCPEYFSLMMQEAKEDLSYDHGTKPSSHVATGGNPYSGERPAVNPDDSLAVIASGKSIA